MSQICFALLLDYCVTACFHFIYYGIHDICSSQCVIVESIFGLRWSFSLCERGTHFSDIFFLNYFSVTGVSDSCVVSASSYGGWLRGWGHVGRIFLLKHNSCLWRAKRPLRGSMMIPQPYILSSFLFLKASSVLFSRETRRMNLRFALRVVSRSWPSNVNGVILKECLPLSQSHPGYQ